ncbi:hypothetical protein RhiirA5_439348 [Rhizophagus irregularis]|uniref:Uncharacterized protein n=1 Tax=Rhizophagus irregularis TaxID=588596 RepID=A0A2N0NHY1_9GLOM|nr:hypothetical protein RhiirA5_439348 [Rhizophagus irregularis]
MVGVQASRPTESIHAYNFDNTRQRYHAKISTSICKLPREEIDRELQKIFNKERFQMEVLFKNGNQYLYVIFTSAQERLRLINCIEIQESVGNFYAESERDCTYKTPIKVFIDFIPVQAKETDLKNVLENEIGIATEITFWPIKGNNQYKKAKIMLEVTCSDKHLIETWSVQMGDNNRIKITPTKLSNEDRNLRTRYVAKVMGLEKEIGLKEVHSSLTDLNAKEWYFNIKHDLVVHFQYGKDKDKAVRTPFKINDKPYTWLQDSRGQRPFRGSFKPGRWNTQFRQNQSRERYNSGDRGNQFNERQQNRYHNGNTSPSNGHNNVNRYVRQNGDRGCNQQQQCFSTGGQYQNNGNGYRQGNNNTNSRSYGGNGYNNRFQHYQQQYNANRRPDNFRKPKYNKNYQGARFNSSDKNNSNNRYQQQYRQHGFNSDRGGNYPTSNYRDRYSRGDNSWNPSYEHRY